MYTASNVRFKGNVASHWTDEETPAEYKVVAINTGSTPVTVDAGLICLEVDNDLTGKSRSVANAPTESAVPSYLGYESELEGLRKENTELRQQVKDILKRISVLEATR